MSSKQEAKPGQYLTFVLNQQAYGVPVGTVREIDRIAEITPVPQTPFFVAGVMNLRGRVIPVVDLRLKFGLETVPHTRRTCIIVIEGVDGEFGAIVDSVNGIVDFPVGQIDPAPTLGSDARLDFITGMGKLGKSVVILVNVIEVLSKKKLLPSSTNEDSDPKPEAA